jgi:hypothetical protein
MISLPLVFLIGTAAAGGGDLLIWSQINYSRNVPIKENYKIPLLFREAIKIDIIQIGRWIFIGVLTAICNNYIGSRLYGLIFALSFVFYLTHLVLATIRYWRAFSDEIAEKLR